MITRNDCLILLKDLKEQGINTSAALKTVMSSEEVDIDIIKFINNQRPLDICKFYDKIRKSYNNKKSSLYINIMKEVDDVTSVLTTLSSLSLQLLLYSKNVENIQTFLRSSRFDEIHKCLLYYYNTSDLRPAIKLVSLIKADIKLFEQNS